METINQPFKVNILMKKVKVELIVLSKESAHTLSGIIMDSNLPFSFNKTSTEKSASFSFVVEEEMPVIMDLVFKIGWSRTSIYQTNFDNG